MMPRMRIPLWAAAAIPVAAYAVRSVLRGSARPDLPGDAIVLGALIIGLALAARYGSTAQRRRDKLSEQVNERDGDERGSGQSDEV
jgi:hypothetical protein